MVGSACPAGAFLLYSQLQQGEYAMLRRKILRIALVLAAIAGLATGMALVASPTPAVAGCSTKC